MSITILGIESSCDDTSAAVIRDGYILSNITAGQEVHREYGGVVPELASRAHQQNIIPVVDRALHKAGVECSELSSVAFTRGPGLMGALLVGASFAKGFAMASGIPLVEVNHLQAHILVHLIREREGINRLPSFPFLSLLVSGGHTQIVNVKAPLKMEILGQTIDDAAGEAFDKCAKIMGLPYPGGPWIDKYAKEGDPEAFKFPKPGAGRFDFSFSGLKTSFMYFLRDREKESPGFTKEHFNDLCASLQFTIIQMLLGKVIEAAESTGVKNITLSGGVAANSGLRQAFSAESKKRGWDLYLPQLRYTTDNAAMIAITGYYKYLEKDFAPLSVAPLAKYNY